MMNRSKTITIPLLSILAIGIVLSIATCNGVNKPDTTYSYLYHKNSEINVDTTQTITKNGGLISILHFSMQEGNNLVFIYKKMSPSHGGAASGGMTVGRLVFQVPHGVRKFSYQDSQLKKIQTLYRKDCSACTNGGIAVTVKQGSISGERINPVGWIITVDATVMYSGKTIHLKFHDPYYEQSLLQ